MRKSTFCIFFLKLSIFFCSNPLKILKRSIFRYVIKAKLNKTIQGLSLNPTSPSKLSDFEISELIYFMREYDRLPLASSKCEHEINIFGLLVTFQILLGTSTTLSRNENNLKIELEAFRMDNDLESSSTRSNRRYIAELDKRLKQILDSEY